MQSSSFSKPTTPTLLSKSGLIRWIRSIVPDAPHLKIQQLGTGYIWCKLINAYFPQTISLSKIIPHPKNEYENTSNLKQLQNALLNLKITVPFDLSKVAKMKFLQNWALANSLYKHFNIPEDQDSRSYQNNSKIKTPKRNFEMVSHGDSQLFRKQLLQISTTTNATFKPIQKMLTLPLESNNQKLSVSSHFFQINKHAIIDRVKQILLSHSHDIQKIRQIKILFNLAIDEDIVKIQQQQFQMSRQMTKSLNNYSQEERHSSKSEI